MGVAFSPVGCSASFRSVPLDSLLCICIRGRILPDGALAVLTHLPWDGLHLGGYFIGVWAVSSPCHYCGPQASRVRASAGLCAAGVSPGSTGIGVEGNRQAGSEGLGGPKGSTRVSLSLWPIPFLRTNYVYLLNEQNFLLRSREKRAGESRRKERGSRLQERTLKRETPFPIHLNTSQTALALQPPYK